MKQQVFKWLAWTAAAAAAAAAGVGLYLQSDTGRARVAEHLTALLSGGEARIQVTRIAGPLLEAPEIDSLYYIQDADTILFVPKIRLYYAAWQWPGGDFSVDSVVVESPELYLPWDRFFADDSSGSEPRDTETGGSPVRISRVRVSDGTAVIDRPDWFPEGPFRADSLQAEASFRYDGAGWQLELDAAAARLSEPRLTSPVRAGLRGPAAPARVHFDAITAEAAGRAVRAALSMNPAEASGTFSASGRALPAGLWRDLAGNGRIDEADATLALRFTADSLHLRLGLQTADADSLTLALTAGFEPEFTITRLEAGARNIRRGPLLAGTGLAAVRRLEAAFTGTLDPDQPDSAAGRWTVSASRVAATAGPILAEAGGSGTLGQGQLSFDVTARSGPQHIRASGTAGPIRDGRAPVRTSMRFQRINPAYWTGDSTIAGALTGTLTVSGRAATPGREDLTASLAMERSSAAGLQADQLTARITSNAGRAALRATLTRHQGRLLLSGSADLTRRHTGTLEAGLERLDLNALMPALPVTTALTGTVLLNGTMDPGQHAFFAAEIFLDSSLVAGQRLNRLESTVAIEDSIATLTGSTLEADFATGSAEGRINLRNLFDLENRLNLALDIRSAGPLQALTGIEDLDAGGTLSAFIRQPRPGELQVQARLRLERVAGAGALATHVSIESDGLYRDSLVLNSRLRIEQLDYADIDIRSVEAVSWARWTGSGPVRGNLSINLIPHGNARVALSGDFRHSAEELWVQGRSLRIDNGPFHLSLQQPFALTVRESGFALDPVLLTDGRQARLSAAAYYADEGFHVGFLAAALPLEELTAIAFPGLDAAGLLDADVVVTREGRSLIYQSSARLTGARYGSYSLDTLAASANGSERSARVHAYAVHAGQPLFDARGVLPLPGAPAATPIDFTAESRLPGAEPIAHLLAAAGLSRVSGALNARLQLTGTAGQPVIRLRAALHDARLAAVAFDSLQLRTAYDHKTRRMQLQGGAWLNSSRLATLDGFVPFRLDPAAGQLRLPEATDSIAVSLRTDAFDLTALAPFLKATGLDAPGGRLDLALDLTGTLDDPRFNGRLLLRDGALAVPGFGTAYRAITLDTRFDGTTIRIPEFRLRSTRGQASLNGTIALNRFVPDSLNLTLTADQLDVVNRKTFKAHAASDLRITGTAAAPRIQGTLTVQDLLYELEGLGSATIEDVSDVTEAPLPEPDAYRRAGAEVRIILPETFSRVGQRILIRNRSNPELELRLTGDLNVVKQPGSDTQLFGTIATTSGFARQFTKKFDVSRGQITFSGPPADPALDVETLYLINRENISIFFRLGGTVATPRFTYESDPPMDTQDIISYTMFGRPFGTLMGWEQNVAGTSTKIATGAAVSETATAFLIEKAGEIAGEKLGIDVIEIDNTNRTAGGGTTIKAGKYISDKTMLAVIQQLGGANSTTMFTLEHQLRRNLQLILTQSEDSRTGVDILWRKDY